MFHQKIDSLNTHNLQFCVHVWVEKNLVLFEYDELFSRDQYSFL
ncbi:hypothetical protein BSMD_038400 [Bacillus subtilis Miyagi-4]|nr:hypothetical protein BSNT_09791 [Bacillus subtilis subsp. natto BEST195]GAK81904.1 hypothetical protein BSMD_038400 [Bacillus subtilis Miyagi-4]